MKNSVFLYIAEFLAVLSFITFVSCGNEGNPGPAPVITNIYPSSGVIGSPVTIIGDQFIPTVPPELGVGPHQNTSIVAFNGTVAEVEYVYQDSVGRQRINTMVPVGATSGKITVTSNGNMVTSTEEFHVTKPIYLPNVEVTSMAGFGLDVTIDSEGSLFLTHNYPLIEIVKMAQDGSVHTLWSSPGQDTPWGIAVVPNGNVYATILGAYILKIDVDGKATTLAGSADSGDVDGPGASARFGLLPDIDVDKDGNLYVADWSNFKIRKITPDGTVSTLAGSIQGYKDGTGSEAKFQSPSNLTVDAEGNVYVADGSRIRKVTSNGQVTTVAGSEVYGYRDGTIANAQFNGITGIAKDIAGNLYLADSFAVRRIAPDGSVVTVAGSIFGSLDGPGSSALFTQIQGMTMDASGHIFLTQGGGLPKIRKITIN